MKKRILSIFLALTMALSLLPATAFAADAEGGTGAAEGGTSTTSEVSGPVKVGTAVYQTLEEAFAQAEPDEHGVIKYEITGTVTVTSQDTWIQIVKDGLSSVTAVEFVGVGASAGIEITNPLSILADQTYDINVSFTNLTLSHPNGTYGNDVGHMTNYFTCALRNVNSAGNTITYTNCTFPNGVCNNQYGKTIFEGCTFTNATNGKYNLWNYGGSSTAVRNSHFTGTRGIKTYNEGTLQIPPVVTVENTTFTGLTQKAAIVVSKATNIELNNVGVASCQEGFIQKDVGTDEQAVTVAANGTGISGTFHVTENPAPETAKEEFQINGGTFVPAGGGSLDIGDYLAPGTTVDESGKVTMTPVATVGSDNFTTLDAAFRALSAQNHRLTLTEVGEKQWDTETPVYWQAGSKSGYATGLAEALTAAYMANEGAITIVCRPREDVGVLTHGHVADDLTIYGNDAWISGGECDLEVDTYKHSRTTGQEANDGEFLEKDIAITAYELDNLGVWGQRNTDHTVKIHLIDCDGQQISGKNCQRVYISGEKGTNNITLTGCDFITEACPLYSNADGVIVVDKCSFTDVQAPININHKSAGPVSITVNDCTFTRCGYADTTVVGQYAAPIRVVNAGGGTDNVNVSVNNCRFIDTVGSNGDILIGDGRDKQPSYDVTLTVTNTSANVQAQRPGYYAENGSTNSSKVNQTTVTATAAPTVITNKDEVFYVARVGEDKYYASIKEAIEAAEEGQTVELLRSVTVDEPLVVNKPITIDGQKKFTISGKTELKNGTLKDLTLTTTTPGKGLLTIGSGEETTIRMEGVTVLYPVSGTSGGTAAVLGGNNADIVITGCLFTNHAENGGTTVGASQWSYGLYMNDQGANGSFTFENSRFDGAFRTMLPNINGTVTITGNHFVNSIFSNNSGSTDGSGEEATCITTAKAEKNEFIIRNNIFDNAGSFYFQKTEGAQVTGNTFQFDKFEHYIQVRGGAKHPLDLKQNTFVMGENDLVIIDTTTAPVLLPAGQRAVSYWAWDETDAAIKPEDYSSYIYAYNEDGSKTFYPESDGALDAFLNPAAGNPGIKPGDTVEITTDLTVRGDAEIPEGAVLVVDETASLTVPEGVTLTNNGTIVNPERIHGEVTSGDTAVVKRAVTFLLTPADASLTVRDPNGAVLSPDGDHVYYLEDGMYHYLVSAQGYYDASQTFIVSGKAQTVSVVLTKIPTNIVPVVGYSVSVDKTANGKVTVSPSYANQGTTVTITVTPDKGYALDALTVTDRNGYAVTVTDRGSGRFTFTMPGSQVTVSASFRRTDAAPDVPAFADVPANAYYAEAVAWAVKQGITDGTSTTTFSPNASCTRAQMVTFLWRANGSPVVNYAMHFEDVPGSAWYAEAVRWAVSQGITTGTSDTTFSPDAAVTRAQAVTFLYRNVQAQGGGFTGSWMFPCPFTDVPADAYYFESVQWCAMKNITTGTSATTFSPSDICTRAQIVTFLYRDAQ